MIITKHFWSDRSGNTVELGEQINSWLREIKKQYRFVNDINIQYHSTCGNYTALTFSALVTLRVEN